MPCPTCDHTMQRIGQTPSSHRSAYWCHRCGTIKIDGEEADRPKLVDRCRDFEMHLTKEQKPLWHTIGIGEAVDVPVNRAKGGG